MSNQTEDKRAEEQAAAQLESIVEMVDTLRKADSDEERDEAQQAIQEDPLSVEVRGDWHSPGDTENSQPTEFRILLCTGGPACQIIGELSEHQKPESAKIQYQDWFTPWTDYVIDDNSKSEALLEYCLQFYFGQ